MDDFKALLNKQITKATASVAAKPAPGQPNGRSKRLEPSPPLEDEVKTAEVQTIETEKPVRPKVEAKKSAEGKGTQGKNTNRVTVNLFDADSRALSIIRELLGSAGHDFTSRSDSIKIGLRLAAKAKPEELAKLYDQVKAEDRRFSKE